MNKMPLPREKRKEKRSNIQLEKRKLSALPCTPFSFLVFKADDMFGLTTGGIKTIN